MSVLAASSFTALPRNVAALKMRAPSRWTLSPSSCAPSQISSITSGGITEPPAMLCVFSISMRPVGAQCGPSGRISADLRPR